MGDFKREGGGGLEERRRGRIFLVGIGRGLFVGRMGFGLMIGF